MLIDIRREAKKNNKIDSACKNDILVFLWESCMFYTVVSIIRQYNKYTLK